MMPLPNPRREIDYTAEAANAQRFVELYGGLPDIFVPRVYTELSTRKVGRRREEEMGQAVHSVATLVPARSPTCFCFLVFSFRC
jgi:hypothetical protein